MLSILPSGLPFVFPSFPPASSSPLCPFLPLYHPPYLPPYLPPSLDSILFLPSTAFTTASPSHSLLMFKCSQMLAWWAAKQRSMCSIHPLAIAQLLYNITPDKPCGFSILFLLPLKPLGLSVCFSFGFAFVSGYRLSHQQLTRCLPH